MNKEALWTELNWFSSIAQLQQGNFCIKDEL